MKWELLINHLKKNKLVNFSVFVFMAVSCVLFAVTICLALRLTGSIEALMQTAETPDFLQMHTGTVEEEELEAFASGHGEVEAYQINTFLNLDSAEIYLKDASLSGSSQDNGLCVQSENFDFLVDMEDKVVKVQKGQIGVPVCYKRQYHLEIGDTVSIFGNSLEIVSFIRDSQMNSMMASSKRFLVSREDYEFFKASGQEEYLIEFQLEEGSDLSVFSEAYAKAGLPQNGPCITAGLVRMMNALSDGMMIMIILFAGVLILLVALLCIRFTVHTGIQKEQKQIGMLKALGISKRDIRSLYFIKYIAISIMAAVCGSIAALFISEPLGRQIKELYGNGKSGVSLLFMTMTGAVLIAGVILFSIWRMLKKTEQLSALEALTVIPKGVREKKKWKRYLGSFAALIFGTMLMIVPFHILSTISAPEFVTYMGIGNSELRLDIRQGEDIAGRAGEMNRLLLTDERVEDFARLDTVSARVRTENGEEGRLLTEYGDHQVFPVSYTEGRAPYQENEIALSVLNAKALGVETGQELTLITDKGELTCRVCGLYSDVTNGGKTAKLAEESKREEGGDVMWSIFYVSLKEGEDKSLWLEEYKERLKDGMGGSATDIEAYVEDTFGQTIGQVRLGASLAGGAAALILAVVLVLFSRMEIEEQRMDFSLKKALGFQAKELRRSMEIDYLPGIVSGILAGEVLGYFLGNALTGLLLSTLGAAGFQFIVKGFTAFLAMPLFLLAVSIFAVSRGVKEINNIEPAECAKQIG